jgi:hypothetical protein
VHHPSTIHLDGGGVEKDVVAAVLLDETAVIGISKPSVGREFPINHHPLLSTMLRTLLERAEA